MYGHALLEVQDILVSKGESLEDFGIPIPDVEPRIKQKSREMQMQLDFKHDECTDFFNTNFNQMNKEQKSVAQSIIQSIECSEQDNVFFIDALGGTGKTFVMNSILAYVRGQGNIAIATASSGIAAILLTSGRTVHSRFKIPLQSSSTMSSSLTVRSNN